MRLLNLVKNTKLLTVLLSVLLVSLSGCDSKDDRGTDLYEFMVDGTPLECISIGHGKSCNWAKYNKLKEAN